MQAACGLLLMVDIVSEFSELRRDPVHALIELSIAASLILGSLLIAGEFRRLRAQHREMQNRLRVASGAFIALLEESFAAWNLTPAEREVALLAIKGFSTAEIAALRAARAGTIRAQCAAIYRKAGVSGRPQLLSHFIDDLLGGAEFVDGGRDVGAAANAPAREKAAIRADAPLPAGKESP
jgi:DNA-binding CsgD family transcriptional regulator